MDKLETLPPPPGVVGSLKAGFDVIASNLTVVLAPLALDLFLWLGPRLHVDQLFQSVIDETFRYARFSGITAADLKTFQENSDLFLSWMGKYNLFNTLRTFPIGVFSLMSGVFSGQTPWGTPTIIQIDSVFPLLGWIVLLTLVGWMCGGLFFRWVSLVVKDPSQPVDHRFGQSILQTILLSVITLVLTIMIGTPMLIMLRLAIAASPLLAQVMVLVLGLFSMWLIVPLFFTPHGIFMRQQNAFASIYASMQMARVTLPTNSLFVLSVLVIAYGLNYLWTIPATDSWMTLIGIAGHAFVTTSLLAASFIYYRDMQVWLQTVFEKLKTTLPKQPV